MNVELGESGGEIYRITREEISVDTIQRVVNLHTVRSMDSVSYDLHSRTTRTKNATFPSLKKYLGCRTNEPSAASASGYVLVDVNALVLLGSITWEAMFMARDWAAWGVPWTAGEVSQRMELTETMEGDFKRFGETMCSLPPQETMRLAMR